MRTNTTNLMRSIPLILLLLIALPLSAQREVSIDSITTYATRYYTAYPDSAQYYLHKGIRLAEDAGDNFNKGIFLTKLIQQKTRIRDYDSARYYFKKSQQFLRDSGELTLLPDSHSELAETYYYMEKMDSALFHFKAADSLYTIDNDSIGILISKNNVAQVHQILGNFDLAIENMLAAAQNVDTTQYKFIKVQLYHNVAQLYSQIQEPELAREYEGRSLELALTNPNWPEDIVLAYVSLARFAIADEDFDKALDLIGKADDFVTEQNLEMVRYQVRSTRAAYLVARGEYEAAISEIEPTLALVAEEKRSDFEAFSLNMNLGISYLETGRPGDAIEVFERMLGESLEDRRLEDIATIEESLSRAYERTGDYRASLEHFRQFTTYQDSVLGEQKQYAIRDALVRYETEKKERQLAETRADLAERELEVKRKNNLIFGGFGLALILGLLTYLVYSRQRLRNRQLQKENELREALAEIETQNKLQEQRLRISRDLHDNIGSQLTFIISSLDSLRMRTEPTNKEAGKKISSISSFTRDTIYELRDTIWAMNKKSITIEDLSSRISNFIDKARDATSGVEFSFELGENCSSDHLFTSVKGMNVYRIIQEAVNNALKHADASNISVVFDSGQGQMLVHITDDGKGFTRPDQLSSHGLLNMEKRAKEIEGDLHIDSSDKGTKVTLSFPG